jgi:hypothetical protein
MSAGGRDRRVFPRWAFEDAVFSYEDGVRFDCSPADIGLGGAFFETPSATSFREGATVTIAFAAGAGGEAASPVYLIGAVVRIEHGARTGIALKWDKAVTTGGPTLLAGFMQQLFGIDVELPDEPEDAVSIERRSVFSFDPVHAVAERMGRDIAREGDGRARRVGTRLELNESDHPGYPNQGPIGLSTSSEEMAEMNVRVVEAVNATTKRKYLYHGLADTSDPEAEQQPPGAVTMELSAQRERIGANLPAALVVSGVVVAGVVTEIGFSTLFIQTPYAPVDPERQELDVRFEIPVRGSPQPVTCACTLFRKRVDCEADRVGLDLSVVALDEGEAAGVLLRYVKWLFHRSITDA